MGRMGVCRDSMRDFHAYLKLFLLTSTLTVVFVYIAYLPKHMDLAGMSSTVVPGMDTPILMNPGMTKAALMAHVPSQLRDEYKEMMVSSTFYTPVSSKVARHTHGEMEFLASSKHLGESTTHKARDVLQRYADYNKMEHDMLPDLSGKHMNHEQAKVWKKLVESGVIDEDGDVPAGDEESSSEAQLVDDDDDDDGGRSTSLRASEKAKRRRNAADEAVDRAVEYISKQEKKVGDHPKPDQQVKADQQQIRDMLESASQK